MSEVKVSGDTARDINVAICRLFGIPIENLARVEIRLQPGTLPAVAAVYRARILDEEAVNELLEFQLAPAREIKPDAPAPEVKP